MNIKQYDDDSRYAEAYKKIDINKSKEEFCLDVYDIDDVLLFGLIKCDKGELFKAINDRLPKTEFDSALYLKIKRVHTAILGPATPEEIKNAATGLIDKSAADVTKEINGYDNDK